MPDLVQRLGELREGGRRADRDGSDRDPGGPTSFARFPGIREHRLYDRRTVTPDESADLVDQPALHLAPQLGRQQREVRPFPLEKNEAVPLGRASERRRQGDPPLLVHLVLVAAQKPVHEG